jgi:hypothetical protein
LLIRENPSAMAPLLMIARSPANDGDPTRTAKAGGTAGSAVAADPTPAAPPRPSPAARPPPNAGIHAEISAVTKRDWVTALPNVERLARCRVVVVRWNDRARIQS